MLSHYQQKMKIDKIIECADLWHKFHPKLEKQPNISFNFHRWVYANRLDSTASRKQSSLLTFFVGIKRRNYSESRKISRSVQWLLCEHEKEKKSTRSHSFLCKLIVCVKSSLNLRFDMTRVVVLTMNAPIVTPVGGGLFLYSADSKTDLFYALECDEMLFAFDLDPRNLLFLPIDVITKSCQASNVSKKRGANWAVNPTLLMCFLRSRRVEERRRMEDFHS